MPRRQTVCFEGVPTCTVKILSSGRGVEGDVWFTCCIEGQEPEIYELWTLSDDGICKVHPYARVQIINNFIGKTKLFNAQVVRIPFLGRRSVNISVQWLDVPQPFGETVIATASWTENIYVNLWGTNPTIITNVPINLEDFARRVRDDLLNTNRVERIQTLQQETIARCLSDPCDEVLSDDDWLENGWFK